MQADVVRRYAPSCGAMQHRGRRFRGIIGVVFVAATAAAAQALPAGPAGASGSVTLYVRTGGTGATCTTASAGACGSIQAAVTKAETYTGAAVTVVVFSGTYPGGIKIAAQGLTSLTISGQGTPRPVATGGGPVVEVSNGTVTISDLEITGGYNNTAGGGVFNASSGELTLSGDVISHDGAGLFGGGIENIGTLALLDDTVSDDEAIYGGGLETTYRATLLGDTFSHDSATVGYGGGVYASPGANTVLTHDVLSADRAPTGGGGGIFVGGTATLTNDTLSGDSASFTGGGAVEVNSTASANLSSDTLAHDSSATTGGGIMNFGSATLTNDTFFTESAATKGGSIYNGNTMDLVDNTVSSSRAPHGGAIYNDDTLSVDDSIVDSGTCGGRGANGSYDVVTSSTCAAGSTDRTVTAARIELSATLAANTSTGPETLAIGPTSAALDEVPSSACTVSVDERGDHRPGDTRQTNCDAGAFELQAKAPSIVSADHAIFAVGVPGTFQVEMATGVFPTPTYSLTGAPAWVSVTASKGILSGTPPTTSFTQTFSFTIEASNGITPPATQRFSLTVGRAPVITSTAATTFKTGTPGSFQVTVAAGTYPVPPTYAETGALPTGVTFSSSGLLSGTAPTGTGGTYDLTITATNGVSPPASKDFVLTVDQPPAIISPDSATFAVGEPDSFQVAVTAHTFPSPTYAEVGTLPTGVTLSPSGLLSGTPAPDTGGVYTFTLEASNGVTPPATQNFTLEVVGAAISVRRVYGPTPEGTAAAELEAAFPAAAGSCPGTTSTRPVVLATDASYPDALSSAYLAGSLRTGTLLTPPGVLSTATLDALRTEGITHVVVVGGPLAVSTAVVAALSRTPAYACGGTTPADRDITVERVAGATEYATARAIALDPATGGARPVDLSAAYAGTGSAGGRGAYNRSAGNASGAPAAPGALTTAILASGAEFQDAESASDLSYAAHVPILLTPGSSLSATAATAIRALHVAQVLVMGGPLAVSDAVVTQLEALGVSVLRVAGATASATGIELAQAELGSSASHLGFGWAPTGGLGVAGGDYWSDGLAGADALAGAHALAGAGTFAGAGTRVHAVPLLLTASASAAGHVLEAFLAQVGASGVDHDDHPITKLTVLGGPLAVMGQVVTAMEAAIGR